jgi:hypothetical protein
MLRRQTYVVHFFRRSSLRISVIAFFVAGTTQLEELCAKFK